MVEHHGVGRLRHSGEEPLRVGDRQQRRNRDHDPQPGRLQNPRRLEPPLHGARRRRQAGEAVAIGLNRHMHAQVASARQWDEHVERVHDSRRVRLHDQDVGRVVEHGRQDRPRRPEPRFLRRKRLGRAREEDPEPAAPRSGPRAFAFKCVDVRLGRVGAHFEKAAPLPPLRDVERVPHVTPHAAERGPERAPPVRLERVRANRLQVARGPGQDRLHSRQFQVQQRGLLRTNSQTSHDPGWPMDRPRRKA